MEKHLHVAVKGGGTTLPKQKIILVSTGRQPGGVVDAGHFKFKGLLMIVLNKCLSRGFRIVDLDQVVAERFFDLGEGPFWKSFAILIQLGAIPQATTDTPIVVADISRLTAELDWQPRWDLAQGIEKTIAWWRQELAARTGQGAAR